MPNVKGMSDAGTLSYTMRSGASEPFGSHARVDRDGAVITLTDAKTARALAVVDFHGTTPEVIVNDPTLLTPLTAAAVNIFVKPFGETKINWRTGKREWKPLGAGKTPTPKRAPRKAAKPAARAKAAPVVVLPEEGVTAAEADTMDNALAERATAAVAEVIAAPVVTVHPATGPVIIPGERVWKGKPGTKVIKAVTKTWSKVGIVMLPSSDVATLEMAWGARQRGRPSAVLITGPAGAAKTILAQEFAFTKGVPFVNVECQSIQTAGDWFGGLVPDTTTNTGWKWEWSDFGLALRRGTPCVINLDELNRVDNERALNGVMSLLAWTAQSKPLNCPEEVTLPPGIMITATLNEGVEYVGTVEVDAAVKDRLTWGVRMDYSKTAIEERVLRDAVPGVDKTTHGPDLSKRLVRVAQTQRAKSTDDIAFPSRTKISTRVLIEVADAVVNEGASPTGALWGACRSRFQPEDFTALTNLIEAQFGPEAVDVSDLPDDDELEQMLTADEA